MEGRSSRTNEKFCEVRSDQFCKTLEEYSVFFESNDFAPLESKKIFHIVVEDGYLLQATKVYRALWGCRKKMLYAHPDDGQDMLKHMVETFLQPQYVYLVMVCSKCIGQSKAALKEMGNKLKKALELYDEKKVILIAGRDDGLAQQLRLDDDVHVSEESVKFGDLTEECQERLQMRRKFLFQGKKMNLEELFGSEVDKSYEGALHGDLLERLARGETIRVGSEVRRLEEPPESCYVHRRLLRKETEVGEADILSQREKVVLITGGAGSGKSVLLARWAATIKRESPRLWVVLIGLQDCTAAFKECRRKGKDAIPLEKLLDTLEARKLATPFEQILFQRKESVVLMLDDIDEVFPDYQRLVLGLLAECRDAPHISKVVLVARLHVVEQLEEELGVLAFTLRPFSRDALREFLVAHWTHRLGLEEANKEKSREKCETYATELMQQVSPSAVDHHFIGTTPLGAKVLVELFEQSDSESAEWEGCREYLNEERAKPKLSRRLIPRLFECFIEEMQTVFMDKANPNGNTMFNCLYEECLACHRTLAVDEVVDKNEKCGGLFSGNRQIDKNLEVAMLKIGIVQKLNNKLHFAYRGLKEYFFAETLLNELQSANRNTEFQKYFIEVVLSEDKFKDIRAFLNKLLKGIVDSLPSDLLQINRTSYLNLVPKLAREGCEVILELVFKYVNFQIDVNIKDEYSETALDVAALNGHLETVKFLVERGADVDIKGCLGWTALHLAASRGHLDTVKFLVEQGADMHIKSNYQQIALHSAAAGGHLDTVKFLVEQGADVNMKSNYQQIALHSAAAGGHLDTVKFLVERGAGVHFKNDSGETALHSAAWNGHLDTVKFLVEQGADLDIKDSDGRTPLKLATTYRRSDIVKFLSGQGS